MVLPITYQSRVNGRYWPRSRWVFSSCVNMVTVAESRRRSALVGTACQRVLLDSSGESHGCVHSCVDDHVDFEPHQVRLSTSEATRRKPAQRVSSVALTRSREPPSTSGRTAQARRGGRFRIVLFPLGKWTRLLCVVASAPHTAISVCGRKMEIAVCGRLRPS